MYAGPHFRKRDMEKWARPAVDWVRALAGDDDINLEIVDVGARYVRPSDASHVACLEAEGNDQIPVVSIYGVTTDNHAICVNVWNFSPYLMLRAHRPIPEGERAAVAETLHRSLDALLDSNRKYSREMWRVEEEEAGASDSDDDDGDDADQPEWMQARKRRHAQDGKHWGRARKRSRPDPGPCVVRVTPQQAKDRDDCFADEHTFFKVELRTPNMVKQARGLVEGGKLADLVGTLSYESGVIFENRFKVDHDMTGAGWARVMAGCYQILAPNSPQRTSTCQLEVQVDAADVLGMSIEDPAYAAYYARPSNMRVLSYDIECKAPPGRFPDSETDPIIQIAATCCLLRATEYVEEASVLVTLGSCDPIAGTVVITTPDYDPANEKELSPRDQLRARNTAETQLLTNYADFVHMYDPDLMVSYNGKGFDDAYMIDRHLNLGGRSRYGGIGRCLERTLRKREDNRASNNYGNRQGYLVDVVGRVGFDVLQFMRESPAFSLRSYTLNAAAAAILGDQKEDLHHSMIAVLQEGDSADRRRLGVYCVKDTRLPLQIVIKEQALGMLVELARVARVQMRQIQDQGSTIKVFIPMLAASRAAGYVIPYHSNISKGEKYTGATVLDPTPGYYRDEPVATLDFASLYPSVMIANNVCRTTHVPPHHVAEFRRRFGPDSAVQSPAGHHFVNSSLRVGVTTTVLRGFLGRRKIAKALMAAATSIAEKLTHNNRQMALKISANSVYGATAVPNNGMHDPECAETVTAYGRDMIDMTCATILDQFTRANGYEADAEVIYGDSVTGDTPVWVRYANGGTPTVTTIDAILDPCADPYVAHRGGDKEQIIVAPNRVQVWTERGWTMLKRVIRHHTTKRILRVTTHTGSVCVTEDHSLLRPDGSEVTPGSLNLGEELMHHALPSFEGDDTSVSVDEAFIMGLFFADGSCGTYGSGRTITYTWAINTLDRALLERAQHYFNGLPADRRADCTLKIRDVRESSGVYTLVAVGHPSHIVQAYRPQFYHPSTRTKMVPPSILNGSLATRESFWKGYYTGDGDKTGPGTRCDITGQVGATGMFSLLRGLEFAVSVNCRGDKTDMYRLTVTRNKQRRPPHTIKKLEDLSRELNSEGCYVYDLETENHHFAAGVGELIVHNTDSVMVKFTAPIAGDVLEADPTTGKKVFTAAAKDAVGRSIALGLEAATLCTSRFKAPNKLELENIYLPYLLLKKKRYAGLFWTNARGWDKMKIRGLDTVRRDNAKAAVACQKTCLDFLLHDLDPDAALAHARSAIAELRRGETDMGQLVVSARLNARWNTMPKHDMRVLKARGKNASGETYLKIECGKRGMYATPQPHAFLDHTLKARAGHGYDIGDRVPYVIVSRGRRSKVYERAEDPVYALEHHMEVDLEYYTGRVIDAAKRVLEAVYGERTDAMLRYGDHMTVLRRHIVIESTSAFSAFVVRAQCVGCQVVGVTLCERCRPNALAIYQAKLSKLRHTEVAYQRLWTRCQACQGSHTRKIECNAVSCPIFFQRTTVKRAYERERALLNDTDW